MRGKDDNDLDRLIGHQLLKARKSERLTQEGLADRIGVKFQQVQKYEKGQNRISASRLLRASVALDRPLDYFCDEARKLITDIKQ